LANHDSTRILIADDDRDAADSLAELLRLAGYAVAVAYNGGDALRKALEFFPEAIVLDLNMPVLTGFEVAERYRDVAGRMRPPIIALSGEQGVVKRAADAGFDHFMTKPVSLAELERILPPRRLQPA
jgi:DNA-binding response OmpR family regulator